MKIKILFFLLFACLPSFSQSIDGRYQNDEGERFIVSGEKMYLMSPVDSCRYGFDTLAICSIKNAGENNYKVKAINRDDCYKTWSVKKSYEKRDDDSVKIYFIMPYKHKDLDIWVGYNASKDVLYRVNVNGDNKVTIPKCSRYIFCIHPTVLPKVHCGGTTIERKSYSSIFFYYSELSIDKETNRIDIFLPEINDIFFSRCKVKCPYLYVKGKNLNWDGKVFKKEKHNIFQRWKLQILKSHPSRNLTPIQ